LVVTFDTPYNDEKPTPVYPGLSSYNFQISANRAGLDFVGNEFWDEENNLVNHAEWNLACMHFVLGLP
jgi:hypothetical protein